MTNATRYQELAQLLREKAEGIQAKEGLDEELHFDVPELLRVLARLLEDKDIHKSFGPPGDWGYSHPIGKALLRAYSKKEAA